MPTLLAASFEGNVHPTFDLRCLRPGQKHPDGWGIGFYPSGEPGGLVLKRALSGQDDGSETVRSWDHLVSPLFLIQLRSAKWGPVNHTNTQPFSRFYARRGWLFAHSGSLEKRFELGKESRFEPVGSTDSEAIQCELIDRMVRFDKRSVADCDPEELQRWYDELSEFGDMTSSLCDGRDLVLYAGRHDEKLFVAKLRPPLDELVLGDEALELDLTRRGSLLRKGILACSAPLEARGGEIEWEPVAPGTLLIVREGAVRETVPPGESAGAPRSRPPASVVKRPKPSERKRLRVMHRTRYTYSKPVLQSTHLLRVAPAHDRLQRLLDFDLSLSVEGRTAEYDDVFGNRVRRVLVQRPFQVFDVVARSIVELRDTAPLNVATVHESTTIPLVWMPWQREVLHPFLLPEELPDSQLWELTDYAMSFARRNSFDIIDTLLDMNSTIYSEYRYKQGLTSLSTTPFEVYSKRAGVCQDFANLFITMARLVGVPARYVCGYIYVAPTGDNVVQSLASHAWAQVYLPEIGWLGFDPTNGVLAQTDHVRVAVGRNYLDATPTSGTLYEGGGGERLMVDVRVEVLPFDAPTKLGKLELPEPPAPRIAREPEPAPESESGGDASTERA